MPYLISGHPGCTLADMLELALALKNLGFKVEQVQDFTPTPGSLSTCMFHTGIDPDSGRSVHVARSDREKGLQKALLLWHQPAERARCLKRSVNWAGWMPLKCCWEGIETVVAGED